MMKRLSMISAAIVLAAMLLISPAMILAQGTPTPFPTPTIAVTASYPSSQGAGLPVLQTVIPDMFAPISTILSQTDQISNSIGMSFTLPITIYISSGNPFSLARGIVAVAGEVPWVPLLMTWFSGALIVIVSIELIKFLVSTWGIIERIIALIKLIPGL